MSKAHALVECSPIPMRVNNSTDIIIVVKEAQIHYICSFLYWGDHRRYSAHVKVNRWMWRSPLTVCCWIYYVSKYNFDKRSVKQAWSSSWTGEDEFHSLFKGTKLSRISATFLNFSYVTPKSILSRSPHPKLVSWSSSCSWELCNRPQTGRRRQQQTNEVHKHLVH